MTPRGPFQPLLFCDSVILYICMLCMILQKRKLGTEIQERNSAVHEALRTILSLGVAQKKNAPLD